MSLRIVIVGGGRVGRELAQRLLTRGDDVFVVEADEDVVADLSSIDVPTIHGDGTDTGTLEEADTGGADVVVAATGDDDTNLLVAQLGKSVFDVERVIARVNRTENVGAFEETGVTAISRTDATAAMLDNFIERPSLTRWIERLSYGGDAQEVEITNPALEESTVADLDDLLPEQCVLVMVSHEGTAQFPERDQPIHVGDRVTLVGEREAVRVATRRLQQTSIR